MWFCKISLVILYIPYICYIFFYDINDIVSAKVKYPVHLLEMVLMMFLQNHKFSIDADAENVMLLMRSKSVDIQYDHSERHIKQKQYIEWSQSCIFMTLVIYIVCAWFEFHWIDRFSVPFNVLTDIILSYVLMFEEVKFVKCYNSVMWELNFRLRTEQFHPIRLFGVNLNNELFNTIHISLFLLLVRLLLT